VVILTTSKAEEDILKTYNLHANCYITKPIDLNQFLKVVQAIEEFWFHDRQAAAQRNQKVSEELRFWSSKTTRPTPTSSGRHCRKPGR